MGFNGAETNCGIAHILSILLMNSYDVISLFQALEWWGRSESERHAKSWRGGKKEKRRDRERERERACNHFFYDLLPPNFGTFEIIRFRLSNF